MKTTNITLGIALCALLSLPLGKGRGWAQNVGINTTGAIPTTPSMLEVLQPGTTAGSIAIYSLHSGTITGTGYGAWIEKTGVSTTNIAGYFSASGGTNNYAIVVPSGGGNVGIGTVTPTATALLTITPTTNVLRNGIDMTLSGATSTATGLNISTGNLNVNGITVTHSSTSLTSSLYGIGGVLSSTNIVSGYNGYRNGSGLSYGIYGINGTNAAYATNANTWAAFLQGRTVISSESSPTSGLGTDLEIRNTTAGAGNPTTVSLRQTVSNTTNATVLANLNFGDNHQTGPQAQIKVIRGAAGGAGDLPTDMIFSTIPDASAVLTERMRILSNGNVGIGTTVPEVTLHIKSAIPTAGNRPLHICLGTPNNSNVRGQIGLVQNTSEGDHYLLLQTVEEAVAWRNIVLARDGGNVGIGITSPTSILHTVASGAKTAAYIGNALTNTATSSTASINKIGVDIQSTGTWNGASAVNTGLTVTASGGTINYGAQFTGYNTPVIFGSSFGAYIQMGVISNTAAAANILAQFSLNSRYEGTGNTYRTPNANVYPKVMEMQNDYIRFMGLSTTSAGIDAAYTPTEWMRITSAGNVGINCNAPAYKLHVIGDIASSTAVRCPVAFVTGAISACSDIRYKKNIIPLQNALSNVMKLQGVNYLWKKEEFPEKSFSDGIQIGFIAQEIEKIFPQVVMTDVDGYKSIDYSRFTPILVEAIREQQKIIDALKFENGSLKTEVGNLKQENESFNKRLNKVEGIINVKAEK